MVTSNSKRATPLGRVLALGFVLATLLVTMLSAAPADAVVPSGKAFAWGDNEYSQLGNGNPGIVESNVPIAVKNLTGVKSMKAGGDHGLALKDDGTVYAWGYGGNGELGNGTSDDSNVPVKVKIDNVKSISAGFRYNLALKENGTVWAWGDNFYGQLGNGASDDSNVPVKVANIGTGAKGIAAGNNFSLALMKDGTVKSWGDDFNGQLGNGTDPARDTPGPVSNLSNVKAIATDSKAQHALALLNNGTAKSWGKNFSGELGDGTSGDDAYRTTPVRIVNLSGVKAVATGGSHSLALLGTGRVKSWGANDSGQLGNGSNGDGTDRSTPGNVIGLENVRSISAGYSHSLAVLESGAARSWGSNYAGQLGNGANGAGTNSDIPISVKNLTNVRSIDGGDGFTLAVTQ